MIKDIVDYIKDNNFKIIYINNSVDIINYGIIIEVKDDVITMKKDNRILFIRGNNLKIQKLLDEELYITGNITKIEL